MKTFIRVLLAVAIFNLGHGIVRADGGYSFDFTLAQKKTGGDKKETRDMTKFKENWAYVVTMVNTSFKDVANIEVKYIIFIKPEKPGRDSTGNVKYQRHEGSTTTPLLKNNDQFVFTTDSVELSGVELADGWVWASGANTRSKDKLRGLWIRVFVSGVQVAEFMDPPELSTKETWDAAPAQ